MEKLCIHGKLSCPKLFCVGLPAVIKKDSVQLLCGYHMGAANRPYMACILDPINCEECKLLENVIPFRRSNANVR